MNTPPPVPPPFGDPTQIRNQNRRAILKGVGCSVGGCLILVAMVTALVVGIVFFVFSAIKKSEGTEVALQALRHTPAAMEFLGEPIKIGWWVTGSANTHNGAKSVDLTLPVSGPEGSGVLRVIGEKPAGGRWQFQTLAFIPADQQPIQLKPVDQP